ncbi:MAG TPA: sigma 54-interacting transcriptional regulator [Pyrinomonadaceae bacterium]|nr:sigma 54-interacting transcriptional regulator [Pyrinomonadaceae bacterium]
MKTSPAELYSEQETFTISHSLEEDCKTKSSSSYERTSALLAEIDSLAETESVAETLELTARLLAEVEIAVTHLSLNRGGFVTVWKSSLVTACETELSGFLSARAETAKLSAHYCGELSLLMKRAAGAILKAAVIQTERCSRRVWQFNLAGENEAGGVMNSTGVGSACGQTSEKAQALRADIERVARLPYNILITGETGTGKTRSAREIHRLSARSAQPFMELNCANLPEQLVEAELFGYRKGAFTGADRDHKGLFEESDGGTLFLDEIGDVPPSVQNKLLKAIDEKQIKRLGTNHYVSCDVQIIAATSRDLLKMIREGSFREDLYCRLAVLKVETVPLRERSEDIPAFIDLFLREAAETVSKLSGRKEEYRIEAGAVEMMCAFDWVGNVRVLRNTLYELTSYVIDNEPITMERVESVLARMSAGETRDGASNTSRSDGAVSSSFSSQDPSTMEEIAGVLRHVAEEGDIVLPIEVCILRRGETFKQWAARAKQLGIEAACRTNGTRTMREAANRLGLSHNSLKSHLYRARCTS